MFLLRKTSLAGSQRGFFRSQSSAQDWRGLLVNARAKLLGTAELRTGLDGWL